MYELWYDQAKTKYDEEAKLWNMDTCGFTAFVKTEDIYKDNSKDVENIFFILQIMDQKGCYQKEETKKLSA